MPFSDILKIFLASHKFTQKQFADKINVKQSQISEWLKGKAKPSYDNIKAMCINFDEPCEYWLGILSV